MEKCGPAALRLLTFKKEGGKNNVCGGRGEPNRSLKSQG